MKGQKKEERKPIEVEGIKEWEVEKILNKRKIREVEKYPVCWKGFIAEHDSWERREDLGNAKAIVEDFEGRIEAEIRRQGKLDRVEVLQISYSLVVILELSGVSEVQYKKIMMSSINKNN